MRTGDDRMWAPIPMKCEAVREGVEAPRPILIMRSFWQRVDPLPDEK